MEKIIFYEDNNFQGRSYECNGDPSDLHSYFSRCKSIRVEGGFWVVYERPDYIGYQYVLTPGEYPDYQLWMGFSDTVRSCRMIRNVGNTWRMTLWERPNFEGQSLDLTDNLPFFHECWHNQGVHSCKVFEGAWVFYEHPNYRGRQWLLEKGECRPLSGEACKGSIHQVKDL